MGHEIGLLKIGSGDSQLRLTGEPEPYFLFKLSTGAPVRLYGRGRLLTMEIRVFEALGSPLPAPAQSASRQREA